MKVATLGSGSRGNSVLVESDGTRLLVDAGFSGSQLASRLEMLEIDAESIAGVVVTHEHRDHTSGIGVAARRWGWTLYMTGPTRTACRELLRGSEKIILFEAERRFTIGDLEIHPVHTCHDAVNPVAVTARSITSDLVVGVATDLGRATTPVRAAFRSCNYLVLESNHDEDMLRCSPYPWSVKQRIGGSRGHLSNRLAADLSRDLAHPGLGGIVLAHLSDECNDASLARETVAEALRETAYRGRLDVAAQDVPGPLVDLGDELTRMRGGRQLSLFG